MKTLTDSRRAYQPKLPDALQNIQNLVFKKSSKLPHVDLHITQYAPHISTFPFLELSEDSPEQLLPLNIGVVFSGGQAPGGHNVITGIFDAIKIFHPNSKFFGFLNGPSGLINAEYRELTKEMIDEYRNQGGFDMLGSGRTKIETEEQFQNTAQIAEKLNLDGLIVIGGDDSNTNAALLAEYFIDNTISTQVIGVPKTIDGDLKNEYIEISFGFDTATKNYSEVIGNLARDALSANKYYFFIKLMGRTASHIALECALKTHPNYTLIAEEIAEKNKSLKEIVEDIANLICQRAQKGKNFGVILIPEGLIEFIPEVNALIKELNDMLASEGDSDISCISDKLSEPSKNCFHSFPSNIQKQLILDRDPHGNVQVSKIETERLLIDLVAKELAHLKNQGLYQQSFNPQPYFCGYEGRCSFPSNFDANYCYALGHVAALLIKSQLTGYMACVQNLSAPPAEWKISGVPIPSMMKMEKRKRKFKPVIEKALVNLESEIYKVFSKQREEWKFFDKYVYPGPIQFDGPESLTESIPYTLSSDEKHKKLN